VDSVTKLNTICYVWVVQDGATKEGYLMKFWLKVAISIIAGLINLPLASLAYDKLYAEPYLNSRPQIRPLVELQPFFSTVFGKLAIAVWVLLAALWIAYGAFRLRKVIIKSKIPSRDWQSGPGLR